MTQSILTALALCFCGGTMWVRRKTWRIRWDRALTMSFLFQGLGFALSTPAMSHYLERPLFRISGVAHLRDFFGHVLFICAICCVIYAAACRLVPDRELESVLYKIEFPAAIAGGAMLAAITLSHNLSREPPPDFLDVPCDFWLRVYWLLSVPLYDDHGGSLRHFGCRRDFGLRAFVGTTNVATYGGAAGDGPRRTERRGAS